MTTPGGRGYFFSNLALFLSRSSSVMTLLRVWPGGAILTKLVGGRDATKTPPRELATVK